MKKELNGGVVVGALVVVVLIALVFAWRAIGPPAPAGIKSFDKASLKVMQQKHGESAAAVRLEQDRAYQAAHGGGQ